MFRREWRQQALVLGLLTVAMAAAVGFASAAYNVTAAAGNAEFGTANHFYRIDGPDPQSLPSQIAAAEGWFGTIDVIGHREVAIPGSVDIVDYRAQDPQGAYGGPMLDLRRGRYPGATGELAVTDHVADTFGLEIGASFALDGVERTVVGVVENPSDLDDEFALVAASPDGPSDSVTILFDASEEHVMSFRPSDDPDRIVSPRGHADDEVLAAVSVLGVATVALFLVALVAAAGFVVVAQRRLRQLGMLGAIGASEKHLRLVVVANGAALGAVAAVTGAVVGVAGWLVVAAPMEYAVGHRIDRLNVPWWVVASAMLLVVVTATGAAWWPARAVARRPVTRALSGRPPELRPAHHAAGWAGLLVVSGVAGLVLADRTNALATAVATVATIVGVLMVSPLAIGALSAVARRLPIAARLALRDLSRYRARSAVALAAISLTLGIPVAIVVTATSAESSAQLGNVSDRQMLVWTRDPAAPEGVSPYYTQDPNDDGFSPYLPRLTPDDLKRLEADVDGIAATLDAPTVTALDLATDPAVEPPPEGRLAVTLAQATQDGYLDVALLYVATEEMLDHYGLDVDAISGETEVLTVPPGEGMPSAVRRLLVSDDLFLSNMSERPDPVAAVEDLAAGYTSLPGSFITPEALRQRGWEPARVGWLVETPAPLDSDQLAAARDLAADAGLLIESRRQQADLTSLRWGATVAGTLVALGILAMTVGLIRSEATRDLRTLTAAGATSSIRRTLTAATSGALALGGALLGTAGAYITLTAGYLGQLGDLTPVPVIHLVTIVFGIPGLAALAGWLLAGREPAAIARQPIE